MEYWDPVSASGWQTLIAMVLYPLDLPITSSNIGSGASAR